MPYIFIQNEKSTNLEISKFNTKNVSSIGWMFSCCNNLYNIDLSSFNTQHVSTMDHMFSYCYKLNKIDLSSFITENFESAWNIFEHCHKINAVKVSRKNYLKLKDDIYPYKNIYILEI